MSLFVGKARPEDAEFLAWAMLAASRSQLKRGIWDLIICEGEHDSVRLDYLRRLAVAEPRCAVLK